MQHALKVKRLLINPWLMVSIAILMTVCYHWIDLPVAQFFHQHQDSIIRQVAGMITDLGKGIYVISFLLIMSLLCRISQKTSHYSKLFFYLLLAVVCAGLLCNGLKIIFSRARPVEFFNHAIYGFQFFKTKASFWSFPSGHTTVIAAFCVGLSLLIPRVTVLALLFAVTIAITRLIVTAHYVSDVIAGFYLGSLLAATVLVFISQRCGMSKPRLGDQ